MPTHLHWRMITLLFLDAFLFSRTLGPGEDFCQFKELWLLHLCQNVSTSQGMEQRLKWLICSPLCENTSFILSCYWLRVWRKAMFPRICNLLPQISEFIDYVFALKMPTARWGFVQERLGNICLCLHFSIFIFFS